MTSKSNFANIRNERNKTGKNTKKLTELDERILAMYGIDIIDGHQGLGEGGFPYEKVQDDKMSSNHKWSH